MFTISIGVCVYNEEKNIRGLLNSLLNQKTAKHIKEIIVVSSACSDKTDEIIENDFLLYYSEIILLKQKKREGKASAINLFLQCATGDIVILESGDTIPAEDAIDNLTEPFKNPKIGMTGGRPVPVNDPNTFMGFTAHLLWNLHHELAMKQPKLGELVGFRRSLIKKIPTDTAVDEAFAEALVREKGYLLTYVPNAVVYNKGPETISDFVKQRRRIFTGHLHLNKTKRYVPASMKKLNILKLALDNFKFTPKQILWTLGAMFLEFYGRVLGSYDFYVKNENPFIWNIAKTTKSYIPETTKSYNSNAYTATAVTQQIKLWQQIAAQESQRLSERSFLPDMSTSISAKSEIMPKVPLDSNNIQLKNKYETRKPYKNND